MNIGDKAPEMLGKDENGRMMASGERLQRHRFERMESKVKLIRWK